MNVRVTEFAALGALAGGGGVAVATVIGLVGGGATGGCVAVGGAGAVGAGAGGTGAGGGAGDAVAATEARVRGAAGGGEGAVAATPGRFGGGGGAAGRGGGAAARAVGCAAAPGGASGVLSTAPTGALAGGRAIFSAVPAGLPGAAGVGGGVGGAWAAGSDALAACVPGGGAGGGGGKVLLPNSAGDALGDDGSAIGAASARCCALVLSAIRALARLVISARFGSTGFGGTVARLGYGSSAPGGGGRCLAISPPCRSCHQLTGFIDEGNDEHPANTSISAAGTMRQCRPDAPDSGPSLP